MPSVQELLAALEADKSPFISLMEGVAGGYANAQQDRVKNAMQLMQLQQMREQQARDIQRKEQSDQLMKMIGLKMESQTQNDKNAAGLSTPVTESQKFKTKIGITTDEKGYLKPNFTIEETTPKGPTSLQAKEYQDSTGKTRIGSFDPTTGKIKQNPDDPFAPKPASELNLGEKSQQYTQKRLTALGDALDPSKQRQGAFGLSKQVFDRAERLQSLASAFPDGNLRRQEIEELAIGLNSMLSGTNTGAQEQVRSLMPKTIVGDVQKTVEWLTNNPTGAQQQEIVKRMMGSVEREKATAADQIKRTQMQRVSRYADLEKTSPDEFYNTLQGAGLDPQEYKAWVAGGRKTISAVQRAGESGGGVTGVGTSSTWKYLGPKK